LYCGGCEIYFPMVLKSKVIVKILVEDLLEIVWDQNAFGQ
jgi:hypothetical protein